MPFNFIAEWIKGTLNEAPDALLRYPVSDPLPQDYLAEKDIYDIPGVTTRGDENVQIEGIHKRVGGDEEYQQIQGLPQAPITQTILGHEATSLN
jgi:hypothetical protein